MSIKEISTCKLSVMETNMSRKVKTLMSIKKISILTTKKVRRTKAKIISFGSQRPNFPENPGKKENTEKDKNSNIKTIILAVGIGQCTTNLSFCRKSRSNGKTLSHDTG
jgi:hypothetical protein